MMINSPEKQRLQTGIQLLYLSWTAILTAWLFDYSILGCELASWDGYERSAWAASIWYDIRHLDLYQLWHHTNQQRVWPPLHSWVTGVLFVLFGASLETARLVCLGSLWVSALFMFRYFSLSTAAGIFAAITSWLLLTTSPFMVHHATSVMSELPGLCLVLAVVVSMSYQDAKKESHMLPGVLLGLLFLYKYNYAGLTYTALFLSRWMQSGFAIRGFITQKNLQLFGIPLLMFTAWMIPFRKEKIHDFLYFAANNPNARTPLSWQSIIMYPIRLPDTFFMAPWVCYVSGGVMLLAMVFNPKRFLSHPVFTLFWVHFLAAVLHPMKDIRFVFIPMGLWYLMTGISLQWIIEKISWLRSTAAVVLISLILVGITMTAAVKQKELYQTPQLAMVDRHEGIIRIATNYIEHEDFVGIFASHDLFMPPAINFYFTTMMDTLLRRNYDEPNRWSFLYLLQSRDGFTDLTEEEKIKALRHELFIRRSNRVIVFKSVAPEKIVNFEQWYGGADEMSALLPKMPEFKLQYEKRYDDIDLLLQIYYIH